MVAFGAVAGGVAILVTCVQHHPDITRIGAVSIPSLCHLPCMYLVHQTHISSSHLLLHASMQWLTVSTDCQEGE